MNRALVLSIALASLFFGACGDGTRTPSEPIVTADSGVVGQPDATTGEPDASSGEDDAGTGEDDAGIGEEDASTGEADAGVTGVTFADISGILRQSCRRCHDGSRGSWDVTDPADMVSVASASLPGMARIEPNNPDRSFLFRKINGTQAAACTEEGVATRVCGARMPPSSAMLSAANRELIQQWIESGAPSE